MRPGHESSVRVAADYTNPGTESCESGGECFLSGDGEVLPGIAVVKGTEVDFSFLQINGHLLYGYYREADIGEPAYFEPAGHAGSSGQQAYVADTWDYSRMPAARLDADGANHDPRLAAALEDASGESVTIAADEMGLPAGKPRRRVKLRHFWGPSMGILCQNFDAFSIGNRKDL